MCVRATHKVPVQHASLDVAIDNPGICSDKDFKSTLGSVSRLVLGSGSLAFELQISVQAVRARMRDNPLQLSSEITHKSLP